MTLRSITNKGFFKLVWERIKHPQAPIQIVIGNPKNFENDIEYFSIVFCYGLVKYNSNTKCIEIKFNIDEEGYCTTE